MRVHLALEGVEGDLERELLRPGNHNQRQKKVVPAPHHREDSEDGERRGGEQKHDPPVDLPFRGIVHPRRVDQLVGDREHGLAEEEDAGRGRRTRPDHTPGGIQQPEFGNDEEDRHEYHGRWDQERRDGEHENQVTAAEVVFRERIGRHRIDEQHDQRGGHGDEHRVPQIAQEVKTLEEGRVILVGEGEGADRLAIGDVDADHPLGRGRIDHLGLDADPAELGHLRDRAVRQADAEERQRLGMARHGHGHLAVGQRRGRELHELGLALEGAQDHPDDGPEHRGRRRARDSRKRAGRSDAARPYRACGSRKIDEARSGGTSHGSSSGSPGAGGG